jgi:hypothetical protein
MVNLKKKLGITIVVEKSAGVIYGFNIPNVFGPFGHPIIIRWWPLLVIKWPEMKHLKLMWTVIKLIYVEN